jgi:hypothetical protein
MAYTKNTWTTGDTITKVKLDNLEGGVEAAAAVADTAAQVADLAPVATTGAYADLTGAPAIPADPADIGAQPAGDYATTTDLSSGLATKVDTSDTRLSDTRTPTDGSVTNAKVAAGAAIALSKLATDPLARANHTGTQSADTLTDGTTNKAFLATERTKLTGIATGATANATDAQLRDRSTHTGTQAAATITGLATVATTGAYADLTGKPTIPTVTSATTAAQGIVELATNAETTTGTDTVRAVTPAGAKALLDGRIAAGATSGQVPVWDGATWQPNTPTAITAADVGAAPLNTTVAFKTANYTFALADSGRQITFDAASAVTATVPTNATVAFPIGTTIDIAQTNVGQVTIAPASGVVVSSRDSATKLYGRYSVASIRKVDTDSWLLFGDVTA